jgi:surface protein
LQVFYGASAFNQNLAGWNTASVSLMYFVCSLAVASLPGCNSLRRALGSACFATVLLARCTP